MPLKLAIPKAQIPAPTDPGIAAWLAKKDPKSIKVGQSVFAQSAGGGRSFQDLGRDPAAWRHNAVRLKWASGLLMPTETINELTRKTLVSGFAKTETDALSKAMLDYNLTQIISVMLLGMSFESLIKGLIIAADPSLVSETRLDKKIGTHNLEALANRMSATAGITLTPCEIDVLHPLLSDLIIWGGRYPIPREKNDLVSQFTHSSQEMKDLTALWKKLEAMLVAKCPAPPPTPAQS